MFDFLKIIGSFCKKIIRSEIGWSHWRVFINFITHRSRPFGNWARI